MAKKNPEKLISTEEVRSICEVYKALGILKENSYHLPTEAQKHLRQLLAAVEADERRKRAELYRIASRKLRPARSR